MTVRGSEFEGNELDTIYVYLPDESVDVWRPVQARNLGGDRYEIVSKSANSEIERWEFNAGDVVRCRLQQLSNGEAVVAYELVSRSG